MNHLKNCGPAKAHGKDSVQAVLASTQIECIMIIINVTGYDILQYHHVSKRCVKERNTQVERKCLFGQT